LAEDQELRFRQGVTLIRIAITAAAYEAIAATESDALWAR